MRLRKSSRSPVRVKRANEERFSIFQDHSWDEHKGAFFEKLKSPPCDQPRNRYAPLTFN
jgi:hypothetical protein